jgi:hypothetical protein
LLVTLLFSSAHARKAWQFGATVGLQSTSIVGDDAVDASYRTGFAAGIYAGYTLSDGVVIRPEFIYSGKGGASGSGPDEITFDFHYFEVPVLAQMDIRLTEEGQVTPYIIVGPTFGFILSSSVSRYDPGTEDAIDYDIANMRPLDIGVDAGIGLTIPAMTGRFRGEVRYSLSFTKAFDKYTGTLKPEERAFVTESGDPVDVKNTGFRFILAYGI